MKYLKRFNESIKNDNDEVINKILKFVSTSYFINKSAIFSDNFKPNKVGALNFVCNDSDITIYNKDDKQILIIRDNLGEKHIRKTIVNHVKLKELFYSVLNIYVYKQLINTLVKELVLSKREVIERVEEFEIIKMNEITGESYLDLISLRSLFDFYNLDYDYSEYIFEGVSNTPSDIIDELLSYVDTDEFFKRTQIYIDRESGEVEVSFMYDDKNIIISEQVKPFTNGHKFYVNYKVVNLPLFSGNEKKLELLYNKVFELSKSPNYISYRRLIRTLRKFLGVEFTEVEERVEEFSIFENNTIDFLSIKSLFEFYKKPYNESVLKQLLKIKETGANTHNINESTKAFNPSEIKISSTKNIRPIKSKVHFINENSFFEITQYDNIYVLIDKLKKDISGDFIRSLDISSSKNRYSGNTEIFFIYDGKKFVFSDNLGEFYTMKIDGIVHNDLYKNKKIIESVKKLHKLLTKVLKSNFYKFYKLFLRYLEVHFKIERNEVLEKIEEFEIIKSNKIDFISLESLFDYYDVKFSKDEMLKWFKDYADKVDLTELVLNESVSNGEISDNNPELLLNEILEVLKDDNFLLSGDINIYERTTIHPSGKSFIFKFKYKDIRMEIGKFPRLFCILYNNVIDMANFGEYMISPDLNLELYNLLLLSFDNNDILNRYLVTRLDISKKEAIERSIEFDVVKNDKIDSLSLNSLFDYYNKPYNDDDTKSYFNYRNIPIS